jgi:hypothetical protein
VAGEIPESVANREGEMPLSLSIKKIRSDVEADDDLSDKQKWLSVFY